MKRVLKSLYSVFNSVFGDENITVYSAYASFYMVISFVPFMIMVLMVAGSFIDFTVDDFVNVAGHNMPQSVIKFISYIIEEILSGKPMSFISIPAIALLWSASRSIVAIIRGLDKLYCVEKSRNIIKTNIYGLFYTMIFLLAILFSLGIMVFGNVIADVLGQFFPFIKDIIDKILSTRAIVSILFLTLLFACMYTFLTSKKLKFASQLPGAVFAAAGWMIFSLLFSVYFDNFSNKFYIYGSLTALILLMLWIYFCIFIIFVGGKINYYLLEIKK